MHATKKKLPPALSISERIEKDIRWSNAIYLHKQIFSFSFCVNGGGRKFNFAR